MENYSGRRKFIKDISIASAGLYFTLNVPALLVDAPSKYLKLSGISTIHIFDSRHKDKTPDWESDNHFANNSLALVQLLGNFGDLKFINCCAVTSPMDQFSYFPKNSPDFHHLIYHFETLVIHQIQGDLLPTEVRSLEPMAAIDHGILLIGKQQKYLINGNDQTVIQLNWENRNLGKLIDLGISINLDNPCPSDNLFLSKIGVAALKAYFLIYPNGNRAFHYPVSYINLNWHAKKQQFDGFDDANQFLEG